MSTRLLPALLLTASLTIAAAPAFAETGTPCDTGDCGGDDEEDDDDDDDSDSDDTGCAVGGAPAGGIAALLLTAVALGRRRES
jgi:MYXO-CTERM domain-containing protein